MPINFRLHKETDFLDWGYQGSDAVELTTAEASVVAQAENAEALRRIADAITAIAEEMREPG